MINCRISEFPPQKLLATKIERSKKNLERRRKVNEKELKSIDKSINHVGFLLLLNLHSSRDENVFMVSELACEILRQSGVFVNPSPFFYFLASRRNNSDDCGLSRALKLNKEEISMGIRHGKTLCAREGRKKKGTRALIHPQGLLSCHVISALNISARQLLFTVILHPICVLHSMCKLQNEKNIAVETLSDVGE